MTHAFQSPLGYTVINLTQNENPNNLPESSSASVNSTAISVSEILYLSSFGISLDKHVSMYCMLYSLDTRLTKSKYFFCFLGSNDSKQPS